MVNDAGLTLADERDRAVYKLALQAHAPLLRSVCAPAPLLSCVHQALGPDEPVREEWRGPGSCLVGAFCKACATPCN